MALSPEQWRTRLEQALAPQQRKARRHDNYYDGRQPLGFATEKFREAFGSLFTAFSVNWCPIVVDAPTERLHVEGFRFGDDADSDDEAWNIWQANYLDADSALLHSESIKTGRAYVLVDPSPVAAGEEPRITVEHPSQVIVQTSGGDRRRRLAAIKRWAEGDGTLRCNIFLPNATYKYIAPDPAGESPSRIARALSLIVGGQTDGSWRPLSGEAVVPNPLGVVTMIPMPNKPSMLHGGCSELEAAEPIQDAINKETADMLVSSEFQAFRQRVLIGVEVPTDPETGQPLPGAELKALQSRIWMFPGDNVRTAEFTESPLSNYVDAIRSLRDDLFSITRTPRNDISGQVVNATGNALQQVDVAGLVAKTLRKQVDFGEGWEEAVRVAFLAKGDTTRGRAVRAHTIWRDAENPSQAQKVDAAIKLVALGLPREDLWRYAGFSKAEIDRMKTLPPLKLPSGALPPTDGTQQ